MRCFFLVYAFAMCVELNCAGQATATPLGKSVSTPGYLDCQAARDLIGNLPVELSAHELRLKEAGEFQQASSYQLMATMTKAWVSKCGAIMNLERLRSLVTEPKNDGAANAILFSSYADLQKILENDKALLVDRPPPPSLRANEIADWKRVGALCEAVRNRVLSPVMTRFDSSGPGVSWPDFVAMFVNAAEGGGSAGITAPGATPAPSAGDFTDPSKLTLQAPDKFRAQFDTTKGSFTVEVTRALAPLGADRFYNLVRSGYFTDVAFFRVIPGFMAQFGIHGDPKVSAAWRNAKIPDDPVKSSNVRGAVTFAMAGRNTRTTQLFINFDDNKNLDGMGFASFGQVTAGMDVVDKINGEYGEGSPNGRGPAQGRVQMEGNTYLKKDFPNLDYIKSAKILP